LPRDVIVLHRFTTQRQVQRLGIVLFRDFHGVYVLISICHSSVLVDDAASKTGDLYIRSVCFSPDGKYLATGAEDKQIRVRTLHVASLFL